MENVKLMNMCKIIDNGTGVTKCLFDSECYK